MDVYMGVFMCVHGFVAKDGIYLWHLWSGARVFRRHFFVYFGAKTIQRALPAKTYETGREGERYLSDRNRRAVS